MISAESRYQLLAHCVVIWSGFTNQGSRLHQRLENLNMWIMAMKCATFWGGLHNPHKITTEPVNNVSCVYRVIVFMKRAPWFAGSAIRRSHLLKKGAAPHLRIVFLLLIIINLVLIRSLRILLLLLHHGCVNSAKSASAIFLWIDFTKIVHWFVENATNQLHFPTKRGEDSQTTKVKRDSISTAWIRSKRKEYTWHRETTQC